MSNVIKIPLIKSSMIEGVQFYSGSIGTLDLIENSEIPRFIPGTDIEKGYQRNPKDKRVNAIKDRVLNKPDSMDSFITNITVNVRVPDAVSYIKEINRQGHLTFEYIEALGPFYLVDGQTRILGISLARNEALTKKLSDVVSAIDNSRVSITLSFTDDVYKEAYFFYLINQYANKIPPEGAMRMIYDGFMKGKTQFVNEITSSSSSVTSEDIKAMNVAEQLYNNSKIWSTRIRDFNEIGAGRISIRACALKMCKKTTTKISKDLQLSGSGQNAEKFSFDVIEAFWTALSKIFPDIVQHNTEKLYGIFKSSQAEVMSNVLYNCLVNAEIGGYWETRVGYTLNDPRDYKTWVKLLSKPLKNFKDQNSQGKHVVGKACWLVGNAGSMGTYTSAAAKGTIANRILDSIEESIGIPSGRVV
jgi:DGQHR domain-containing protein